MPHKVSIIPLLDGLDPLAEKIGAVNTVVNRDGKFRGYNTDADGFLQALLQHGIKPMGKKVVVLGAGGASRAIAYILAEKGARVTIVCRQTGIARAKDIAAIVRESLGKRIKIYDLAQLAAALEDSDMLVNATSVGMSPAPEDSLVPAKLLKKVPVVCDIVYHPLETRLLRDAKAAGRDDHRRGGRCLCGRAL